MKLDGEGVIKRFKRAKKNRSVWEDLWQDVYDYVLPARAGFFQPTAGEERTHMIYDETALVALADFVSRMQAGNVPSHQKFWRFEPGPEYQDLNVRKRLQGELDEVTDFIWESIINSNFANESQEVITDIAVGWSDMLVTDGTDGKLLNFKCIPQSHTYWDVGPFKTVDGVFRIREDVKIADLKTIWPDAKVSAALIGKMRGNPEATTDLIEASYRDWAETGTPTYIYQVVAGEDKSLVIDTFDQGIGARPHVTPRWSVAAGECYGRGPLINALPAVRTANLVTELVLENAQMSISGIWQVDDDGTISVDNVEIVPGAVYARAVDSRGLERTDLGTTNFSVADIVLSQQQENIRRALFAQNLGPLDQTPRSATEINARMTDLAEQTAGPAGRLKAEWIDPMLQRIVWLLEKRGLIEMPLLNGRQVRIVSKSPIARAQRFEDIERMRGFAGDVISMLGPQLGQAYLNQDGIVDELREKWEVPNRVVRDQDEREAALQGAGDAALQGAGGGTPAPGGLPAQLAIGE